MNLADLEAGITKAKEEVLKLRGGYAVSSAAPLSKIEHTAMTRSGFKGTSKRPGESPSAYARRQAAEYRAWREKIGSRAGRATKSSMKASPKASASVQSKPRRSRGYM